jgi:hypothetical protein
MTSTHCESRRFSIRLPRPLWVGAVALVLIVVAFGISFGVPIYRQQAARREIGRLGGRLEEKYHGPQWLRRLLGYDRTRVFDVINVVRLGGTDFGDGDMQFLIGLGSVEHVVLYDTKVTDSALVHLRTLGRLKRLYLHGTQVTDEGIKPLTALSQLRVLDLSGTEITDAGLEQLGDMKTLVRLYVDGTEVTDAGVAELQRALPSLNIRR